MFLEIRHHYHRNGWIVKWILSINQVKMIQQPNGMVINRVKMQAHYHRNDGPWIRSTWYWVTHTHTHTHTINGNDLNELIYGAKNKICNSFELPFIQKWSFQIMVQSLLTSQVNQLFKERTSEWRVLWMFKQFFQIDWKWMNGWMKWWERSRTKQKQKY